MSQSHVPESTLPLPFDAARAVRTFEALSAKGYEPQGRAREILASACGNSPYLARLAVREVALLGDLFQLGPDEIVARAIHHALAATGTGSRDEAMTGLRAAKREAALAIGLADIGGTFDLGAVTRALTEFADASVRAALRFELLKAAGEGAKNHVDAEALEAATGVIVLAMGKYGAGELNYSSDIDLVVFYDPKRFPYSKREDARGAAIDIVRGMVRLLNEVTAEGYVFRTDLRLRPDAGATQIAISTDAAEDYYESMGQNWERAALIKARACAGDPDAATSFLSAIDPFIWRRTLDFAAIEDIHSIKRQIHAGHGRIAVKGHNIKTGRGGIREIEFFVQTQQLILGGRDPGLRHRATLDALDALARRGHVDGETAQELARAYRFLRTLEHRLQMVDDQQTHTLPNDDLGLAQVACFMGYPDATAFGAALSTELKSVQDRYAQLFEAAPELGSGEGNLVFTGVEDDPDTIGTLKRMGFQNPAQVAQAVRAWHHGRIRATRSSRARELLTRLMPALLDELARTPDPDAAFMQFDRFVSNLPSGVHLFSLFAARGDLLRLIAEITGSAPRLARHLGRNPATLDALLDPDFLVRLPERNELRLLIDDALRASPDYESKLDAARRFVREQSFRVGVQVIEGSAKAGDAGPAFAEIAESVIEALLPVTEEDLARTAGRVPGGAFAVIAMGKLGGREMTAGSDLDLIFVYEAGKGIEESDGARPLAIPVYYARLAQRFLSALTTPTAAGALYEVDMRLRPTGNKGPAAVSLSSFARYHEKDAWTWERLAVTRARVVSGPEALKTRIEKVIERTITRSEPGKVRADAREMRAKLAKEFPPANRWDIKYAPGGLIDIEFIAQTMQLHTRRAASTNTILALEELQRDGALKGADAKILIETATLQHALTQVLRITLEGPLERGEATPGLKNLLARAGGALDFSSLESKLFALQDQTRAIFLRLIG